MPSKKKEKKEDKKKEVKLSGPVERICGCGEKLEVVEGGPLVDCICGNKHN